MRILIVISGLLAALGVGLVAFGRFVDDFTASLVLQAIWFAVVAAAAARLVRRAPDLRAPVAGTLALCAVLGAAAFYWTTLRDERVDEEVVTGVSAAEVPAAGRPAAAGTEPPPKVNVERAAGTFASLAHETTGRAAVVELAGGGRRLTLTDLRTDNGPDLLVYLVPGASNAEGSVKGGTSLGRLKGNIGTQQYVIPEDVRVTDGASVVIWCRAFTVAFGVAELELRPA